MKIVYLDNAATTYPKPPEIVKAVSDSFKYVGNPGRGSHRLSEKASEIVYNCRESVAGLFSANAENVAFTMNATQALNYAIKGLTEHGDHLLIDSLAHNASYRPLMSLVNSGFCSADIYDSRDISDLENKLRPNTKVIITTHQSNISSDTADIEKIGQICAENGIKFIVDASQSAGHIPIDMRKMNITSLCMPGHKGLFGPMGVGILVSAEGTKYKTVIEGGTGVNSLDTEMPDELPERLEAGTLPLAAIAGLNAGISYITKKGVANIESKVNMLSDRLFMHLSKIEQSTIYGSHSGSVVSFNVDGILPSVIGEEMSKLGICLRTGYHCAPLAHKTLGSYENGSVRVSLSPMNTVRDMDTFASALSKIITNCKNAQPAR